MECRIIKRISIIIIVIAAIPLLAIVHSCYYDNEETLYPGTTCDTTNVTFSRTIQPMITADCGLCHSGGSPSGNIALDSYDNIKKAALIAQGQRGSLYGTITWSSGNIPMPQGAQKLSDCTIREVKIWIDASTPNN
jgi:hypothetical protein